MVNTLRTSFASSLLFAFVVYWGSFSAYAAEEPASLTIEPSVSITTAGQQIELALTIRYNEGIDVIFNPRQQDWGEMELLSSHAAPIYWVDGQWQRTVYMDTTFLMPDDHHTPVFKVDVFDHAEYWQLETPSLPIEVLSSFDNHPVDLQETIQLPGQQTASSNTSHLFMALAVIAVLASVLITRRRKGAQPQSSDAFRSALELATEAESTGTIDWEALRQWLMVTTGADPTGKLTTSEPLLYRYQTLRFGRDTRLSDFIDYCHRCQEKWG